MKSEGINLNNYGAFVLDYIEGRLDPVGTAELLLFFEQNPQLKEESSQISNIFLKPDAGIAFGFSEALLQPADINAVNLNTGNFDHYFIAASEGDLSATGIMAVENFIHEHPELSKELNLYKSARLLPDKRLGFPSKNRLRKPAITGIRKLVYYGAAAATIFLLISVYLRLEPTSDSTLINTIGGIEKPVQTAPDKNNPGPASSGTSSKTIPTLKKFPLNRVVNKPADNRTNPAPVVRDNSKINGLQPRLILNVTGQVFDNQPRSFYSNLFDDISLSQEIMLAGMEPNQAEDLIQEEMESLVKFKTGRRLGSLFRSGAQIASQIPESLNGWMLADLGISGMNLLTDNELKLQRNINPEGRVENIRLSEGGQDYSLKRDRN